MLVPREFESRPHRHLKLTLANKAAVYKPFGNSAEYMREKVNLKRKKLIKKGLWWACFVFLGASFSWAAASYLDPDFGWHLKTGEWIWQNQAIPQKDMFSYTMPDYPWQTHAWFSELTIYRLYSKIGYSGLAIFFGLIGALALTMTISFKVIFFALGPVVLAGLAIMNFLAVRPKGFSVFFFSLTVMIIQRSFKNHRNLLLLPFVFVVWVQLHGGFFLGLVMVFLLGLSDLFQLMVRNKHKINRHFQTTVLAFSLSFLVIRVNPYGWQVYDEIFSTLFNNNLHWRIAEWMPYNFMDLSMVIYASLFWSFFITNYRRLSGFDKLASVFLFLAGFSSQRLIIYFFIFSLPVIASMLEDCYQQVKKEANFLKLWRWRQWALLAFLVFSLWSAWWHQKLIMKLKEANFYPAGAISFIRKEKLSGNLFSVYNWGGYLVWQLPEKKVFIDGRMAIWEQDGYSAFEEYCRLLEGKLNFEPVFEKYGIGLVLLPGQKPSRLDPLSRWLAKINPNKQIPSPLSQRLVAAGWQVVYEDDIARILQKNKSR